MTKGVRGLGGGLVISMALATGANADLLFGTRGSQLFLIDTDTSSGTLVGSLGVSSVGGLAFGLDGTLHGLSTSTAELVTIDTATGLATVVGDLGSTMSSSTGLGHDPTTGTFYAVTTEGVGISSFLTALDTTSGATAPVGETGASAVVGLTADPAGMLWGVDGGPGKEELLSIDPSTGAATVVLANGLGTFTSISSLDVGPSGTLWAVNRTSAAYELIQIDPTTGTGVSLGPIAGIPVSGALTGLASFDASFQLYPPGPGAIGSNTMNVSGAPPNESVLVFAGTALGSVPLEGCPGVFLGVTPLNLVAHGVSDGAGVVTLAVEARPSLVGLTLNYQAAAVQSCTVTPIVSFAF